MKKKLLLRLCLILTVSLSLYSCTNEDLYSSSENEKREVASKSLWKEDMVYINNVKESFLQHADLTGFKEKYGDIQWEYAMTFDKFDESYLMAPLLKNGTVWSVAIVERKGEKIYFSYSTDKDAKEFFSSLIFKKEKAVYRAEKLPADIAARAECTTRIYHLCFENLDGSQDCYPKPVTKCIQKNDYLETESDGGTGDGGLPYGGGTGYQGTPTDPCEKTKAISTDPAVKAKVGTLKEQSKIKGDNSGEKGFNVNLDGTTGGIIPGEKHSVDLGSEAGKQGGYHNHTPDGIKMHSPPDILKMLNYALAQPNGNLSHGFLGFVGSEKCSTCPDGYKYHNYIIRFSGNSQELEKFIFHTNWDKKALGNDYQKRENNLLSNSAYTDNDGESLNQKGLEKLFFDTLKGMNMEGKVNLQRVDNDGTIQNIILDNNNQPTAIPCP